MPRKRKPTPSKHSSPLPSSSTLESEKEQNNEISTPISSQSSKKTISNKPTSNPNQTQNPEKEENDEFIPGSDSKPSLRSRGADPRTKPISSKGPKPGDKDMEVGAKKLLILKVWKRVWSPNNEIKFLKGMIEFSNRGPADVSSDLTGFHQFIKKSLHLNVTRNQVSSKMTILKRKYRINAEKEAREGEELVFPKKRDRLKYQLSKKIWGERELENVSWIDMVNEYITGGGNAKSGRKFFQLKENLENHSFIEEGGGDKAVLYPHLNESLNSRGILSICGLGESDVKRAFELMSQSQAKAWDQRCMKLRLKERDIHMERATLVYEFAKQCYDLVKSPPEM